MTTALTVSEPRETRRHILRKWIQRLALLLLVLGPFVFLIAAVGYKMGWVDLGFALRKLTFMVGPGLLIGAMIMGLVGFLAGIFIKPQKGLVTCAIAFLIPALGMLYVLSTQAKLGDLPFIHDVTTDTQNPPTFSETMLAERAKIEGVNTVDYVGKVDKRDGELVSVLQVKAYPDIRPLVLSDAPDVVFGRAQAAVKAMGWEIVTEDVATGRIEATDTTFWYGFKDDVVIRIQPSEGGGSVLDIRSISRIGGSDLGKNADRIRAFLKEME